MSERSNARRRAARLLLSLLVCMSCGAAAWAEDVVYLKPNRNGQSTQLRGEVVEYTGIELRLKNAAGNERKVSAAQVERVETQHSQEELAGDRAFERGDFRGAIDRYRAALEASREGRDWVRRQILAQIIWCQRNLEDWDQAGEYFLILLASDPATRDFDCIPLAWLDERPSPVIERKAQAWLAGEQPAAVLMGASHLLTSPSRPEALTKLRQLLTSNDPRVAWLAYVQLWRAGSNNATAEQRQSFAGRIDASDEALRAGAYYVLGRALVAEQPEDAALALMRLPVLYEREYRLSAAALLDAGACLETLDRSSQAAGLYRELSDRYADSPFAREAQTRLERLASKSAERDNTK